MQIGEAYSSDGNTDKETYFRTAGPAFSYLSYGKEYR